ncbi:unnamed protein product [Sphenostylis stenocarpa]|uniref:Protein kinase domain-containing protein n=1 Tax=Sphenostylis stenocarpa TaxID=92480 RepID=A0AA86W2W0_9FABA|nr:unnamed protein product [Sphenostylis stenocarpa]
MHSESGVSPKKGLEAEVLNSKENLSGKNMIFRTEKIDLRSLDVMLEKHLTKIFTKGIAKRHKEAWEIDLAKLDLHYSVAKGTYGTVYKGTYDSKDVAVKVLDWGEDGVATANEIASLRASFWQEVTVWQKLDHPNVTKFIGASVATSNLMIPLPTYGQNSLPSKTCCVIAEFLPGGTLRQYLFRNRRNKLPYKVVIQLALDLSRGLSYLHSKKIVHRDVKPDNMLLDANQNLKIADFGVARVDSTDESEMTSETGTYGYMAPEVLSGKPYNRKCDVYSFGICLWEIYCRKLPISKLSLVTVSCAVMNQRDFENSLGTFSGGFGSPIELPNEEWSILPSIGLGLGSFVQITGGDFLKSMSPSLFRNAKNCGYLVTQAYNPVVLPAKMGTNILDILLHVASDGVDELCDHIHKLLPGKSIEYIAWEATTNKGTPGRGNTPSIGDDGGEIGDDDHGLVHLRPEIPRSCPGALANIIRKCWDAKPDRRPEMHEVVEMLEAIDTSQGETDIRVRTD